jgi:hypothetical protein
MPCKIWFLTTFLGGTEIRFLLSVLLVPTTILGIVYGLCTPMLLAQVAMLHKTDFSGDPGRRFGTLLLLPILTLVRSFLGRFQLGLLLGTNVLNCLKRCKKQTQIHRRHALLGKIVLVLPLDRTYPQYMAP